MARTPWAGLLRRGARLAAIARATGAPLDELIERERAARFDASRRRVLAGGAAAATLALAACARVPARPVDDD